MRKKLYTAFLGQVASIFLFSLAAFAQANDEKSPYSTEAIEQYKEQSKRLVSFFQFTLNTIGDPETPAQEKETIIQESYSKFFRDDKVQIEDDLDDKRVVPTNKNVQAYLKDVDFFFKNVRFEFSIDEVTHFTNQNGELVFKVAMSRNLRGTTIDNQEVNNAKKRFVEINLNAANKDLKIASIYTTRLSLKEELSGWWSSLSPAWKETLAAELDNPRIMDSLRMDMVTTIDDSIVTDAYNTTYTAADIMLDKLAELTNIESINIERHPTIRDLTPLNRFNNLTELNIAGTKVNDLTPIRNLTQLKIINFSNTNVSSLEELKYAISLEQIYCNNSATLITISAVKNFKNLQILHCHNNGLLGDISPVAELENLRELNCDNTAISDISPLAELKQLTTLKISGTRIPNLFPLKNITSLERLEVKNNRQISDLSPLQNMSNLRLLFIDNTSVSDLSPLNGLQNIRTIYCDGAEVDKTTAEQFMQSHPNCLVVYETGALEDWWASLDNAWQAIFRNIGSFPSKPDKEELHEISNIKMLDISNNGKVKTLTPLSVLFNLEELNIENTLVTNLSPLKDLSKLTNINLAKTNVSDLSPIQDLKSLKEINFSNTEVASITPLKDLNQLKTIYGNNSQVYDLLLLRGIKSLQTAYFDDSPVNESKVNLLYEHNNNCLIVYNTPAFEGWWRRLPDAWKQAMRQQGISLNENPTKEQLHQLSKLEELNINGESAIKSIEDIQILSRLKKLRMGSTGVTDISSLARLKQLKLLYMPKNFVRDISAVSNLSQLVTLDIEDAPIEDLEPLAGLRRLETLNCSGTKIRDLDPLERIKSLRHLSCYGTDVKNLKAVEELGLKTLKCYNTRISERRIERFKESNRNCEVVY